MGWLKYWLRWLFITGLIGTVIALLLFCVVNDVMFFGYPWHEWVALGLLLSIPFLVIASDWYEAKQRHEWEEGVRRRFHEAEEARKQKKGG